MNNFPLVSCLCVTHNRIAQIARAIACFQSQTYPNKQLVIVYEDKDVHICKFLQTIDDPTIKCIQVPYEPKLNLGELRNISIDHSDGEYICQWDSDDWFHNNRLQLQMRYILKMHKPICFLTYWIMYDSLTEKAYLSRKRLWEGTILCKKDFLLASKLKYPNLEKLEDFKLVEKLLPLNVIYPIDIPNLYIYVYHGENTWHYQHFKDNFNVGQELSESANKIVKGVLEGKYTNEVSSELMDSPEILQPLQYAYTLY
ncbi:glycosyltransferase family 2 protein [Puia dinghuensis]|nr:glycosyltransferase family A protein [Puia dinghuensis]